jgi:hypothetical protein
LKIPENTTTLQRRYLNLRWFKIWLPRLRAHFQRHRRAWLIGLILHLALFTWLSATWFRRKPYLHIVNTTDAPLILYIDERSIQSLPVVSMETPGSPEIIRLSPGIHRLTTKTASGSVVDDVHAQLYPWTHYLFAPGQTDQCFWVQRTFYGAVNKGTPKPVVLPREKRVWPLPSDIDMWFVPTPEPGNPSHWFSGGTRTALRQSRCGFITTY